MRRLAGDDPEVNEEWNCDKGRWGVPIRRPPRPHHHSPRARQAGVVGRGAQSRRRRLEDLSTRLFSPVAVFPSEDAYAYSKFARVILGNNNIDFRARPSSDEEAEFLAARIAGRFDVTYRELETAGSVYLADFEPEDESPIVFL